MITLKMLLNEKPALSIRLHNVIHYDVMVLFLTFLSFLHFDVAV